MNTDLSPADRRVVVALDFDDRRAAEALGVNPSTPVSTAVTASPPCSASTSSGSAATSVKLF
ncbi:hypothetical protein, partial [Streptomyces nojiriensis]|uniref:hypothetical protein n=1 Tax=Streptomyces nojiriensis TaxID=66374 RepID=UPI00364B7601